MVTDDATPDLPWSEFGLKALDVADRRLDDLGHGSLSLREIASAAGGTHPAILKQFGSQLGFLAELAARQWDHLTAATTSVAGGVLALALADIGYAVDNPHRFRLMYDYILWDKRTDPDYRGSERESLALERMEAARNSNFLVLDNAMVATGRGHRTRMVAALMTGLAIEFVNERLFGGDRDRQLAHAAELLRVAVG